MATQAIEQPLSTADHEKRRRLGQYFTSAPLVDAMWQAALLRARASGLDPAQLRVIDLAAGEGAFLAGAQRAGIARAQILAVELDPVVRDAALEALSHSAPAPEILLADATAEAVEERLLAHARRGTGVLIIGNPPYNGSSALWKHPRSRESIRSRLLPYLGGYRPRSGFRDDFAFFLALARRVVDLSGKPGTICLILPRTLLEAHDYSGAREALCAQHQIDVLDVGPDAFADARVSTAVICLGPGGGVSYQALRWRPTTSATPMNQPIALAPRAPGWILRPERDLEPLLRGTDPITDVLQRWFTPHKTGFDELMVSDDSSVLRSRLQLLVDPGLADPERLVQLFSERFGPQFATRRLAEKLEQTRSFALSDPGFPHANRVRAYLRFNPRRARFSAPAEQWRHVYFEPRISKLFNHAFSGTIGAFDPHAQKPQLLFNAYEPRSYAMVVDRPGVLHLYQHTRFAPLEIPEGCWAARGKPNLSHQDRGALRLNVTASWAPRVRRFRRPDDLFHFLAGLGNSALARKLVAPELGTQSPLPVPRFDDCFAEAQQVADLSRALSTLSPDGSPDLEAQLEATVVGLYLSGADPRPWLAEVGRLPEP